MRYTRACGTACPPRLLRRERGSWGPLPRSANKGKRKGEKGRFGIAVSLPLDPPQAMEEAKEQVCQVVVPSFARRRVAAVLTVERKMVSRWSGSSVWRVWV
jgi:hypothetical protein